LRADRLDEPISACRAFNSEDRRRRFDISFAGARGFTSSLDEQVQFELDWRSRCGYETSGLLALSFNPLRGPFGPSSRFKPDHYVCFGVQSRL
jgi:hypothetical protein